MAHYEMWDGKRPKHQNFRPRMPRSWELGELVLEPSQVCCFVKFQMLSCYHQHVTLVTFGAAYFSTYDHMAPTWIVPIATWEVLRKIAPALSASSDGHELIPALICWGTSCFPAGAAEQRWASLLWSSSYSPSWRWSWSWTLGKCSHKMP